MLREQAVQAIQPIRQTIEHNYLPAQFADADIIWSKIRRVVKAGDFTLGQALREFECQAADVLGVKHVIGVNSGTDALILILKALGITGEVLVPAFTFVASVAAIELAGATPVLVDVGPDFNMDPSRLEAALTPRTEAILPVHWAGRPCDMWAINVFAQKHGLAIVEDACHAIGARYDGAKCGALGNAAAFSLHPLKNVNVWGDGGFVSTNSSVIDSRLRHWRNHGMTGRNVCQHYGHNSRLDTIQAVVASHVLGKLDNIVGQRNRNAMILDNELINVPEFVWEPVLCTSFCTYYLYTAHAEERDNLMLYLINNGVDAKAHYPIAQHMQPAAAHLGYKKGDFPVAEYCADTTISLPIHEFVTEEDLLYVAGLIKKFYGGA